MKHKTFDLYRCSALVWARLPYEEALNFRIIKANIAMLYYRQEAKKNIKNDIKYQYFINKYTTSQEAKQWNEEFLEEIIEERKKNGIKNYKRSAWSLFSEWI